MFTHQKISLAEYASKCMLLDKAAVGSKRLRMSTLGHDNKFIKPKKKTYITLTLNRVFYDIEKGLAFILAPDSMKFMNKIEPLKKSGRSRERRLRFIEHKVNKYLAIYEE